MKLPSLTPPRLLAGLLCMSAASAQTNVCTVGDLITAKPLGLYAIVNIDSVKRPLLPQLGALYASLLSNPAVSGLALVVQWSTLNNTEGAVPDWTYLDEAFNQVSIWNRNNPSAPPKTIQLTVTAGFGTPAWALDQILPSCDALFQSPQGNPGGPCGQATFLDSEGMAQPALMPLPLPWNTTYQGLWQTFLKALAAKYVGNPAFASIAVAGPTATSAEMILPTTVIPAAFQAPFGGLDQTGMWSTLLASQYSNPVNYSNPAYQNSDLAIVDAWNAATEMYASVFNCTTLIVTSGDGLPNSAAPSEIPYSCGLHTGLSG